MKTDIQIAQEAEMLHIREVAAKVGIEEEDLEFYGKYKAKLSDELMERVKDRQMESWYLLLQSIRLRRERGRRRLPLDLERQWQSSVKKL